MENDELIYTVIKTAVTKGIKYIEDNPKRGVRNLVDVGEYFATGRFQKDFFDIANDILNNKDSSYYQIIDNAVKKINHEILISFGINLGYNSWTRGANIVRQHEMNCGYNIPWTVIFNFEKIHKKQLSGDEIGNLILSGKNAGIYCYMFMVDKNDATLENVDSAITDHPDCAFILFINTDILTSKMIENMKLRNNIFISLLVDDLTTEDSIKEIAKKTELLARNKCLFGVYKYYDDYYASKVLNGQFAHDVAKLGCSFAFLIKKEDCSEQNSHLVSEHVKNARMKNNSPVFIMDFYEDIANIDRNISSGSCFLSIDSIGQVTVSTLFNEKTPYNIRTHVFEQILENLTIL